MATGEHRQPVTVGVDGADSTLHAVRGAAESARRRRLPLRLVHAYQVPSGYPRGFVDPAKLGSAMRWQGEQWLQEALASVVELTPDLRPEVVITEGPVVAALIEQSRTASQLVLGTRGLGGFTGLLIGSTAVALAGRGHCPLIVMRGRTPDDAPPATGPVVVGMDATPANEPAVAFAFEEAALRGTGLVVVHSWTDSAIVTATRSRDFEPGQALPTATDTALDERLAGWAERYPDVAVVRDLTRERPAPALLRHTRTAQLAVLGSRGLGGFRGLVLGSTSHHLLHHAACPVAIVRTGATP